MIKSNHIPNKNFANLIPLTELPLNRIGVVKHLDAGMKATMRLTGMGITPGTPIKKLSQAIFKGPIQIQVRDTRLALGRGIASRIFVELD